MARPRLKIDPDTVEKLAMIGCTNVEIAAIVNCSVDTLARRFAEKISKGREKGKGSLRRLQWQSASGGSVAMQIWLGKQMLGQREKAEITGMDGGPIQTESKTDIGRLSVEQLKQLRDLHLAARIETKA